MLWVAGGGAVGSRAGNGENRVLRGDPDELAATDTGAVVGLTKFSPRGVTAGATIFGRSMPELAVSPTTFSRTAGIAAGVSAAFARTSRGCGAAPGYIGVGCGFIVGR